MDLFFAYHFEGGQTLSVSVKKNQTPTCDKNLRFNLIVCHQEPAVTYHFKHEAVK